MKRLILLMLVALAVASAQPNCSLQTLRGTYAVSYWGIIQVMQPGAAPAAVSGGIVGAISIGYDGTVSGAAAVSGMGPVTDYEVGGTAQVNPDCTGKLSLKVRPKGTQQWGTETDRFVFDPDTKTLLVIIVDLGPGVIPAVQGTWKQISSVPNTVSW